MVWLISTDAAGGLLSPFIFGAYCSPFRSPCSPPGRHSAQWLARHRCWRIPEEVDPPAVDRGARAIRIGPAADGLLGTDRVAADAIGRLIRMLQRDSGRPRRGAIAQDLLSARARPTDGRLLSRLSRPRGSGLRHRQSCRRPHRRFRRIGARVLAVEPQPALARTLRWLYGRDSGVRIEAAAVGREAGRAQLRLNRSNPTVSTLSPEFISAARERAGMAGAAWDGPVDVACTRRMI
jgi:hypothetical protein